MLLSRIQADQLEARKARDKLAANILGTLLGDCGTRSHNLKPARALTDAEVISQVQSMLRKINETVDLIRDKPERKQQLADLLREADYLQRYLPRQLSDEEITEIAVRQHAVAPMNRIMEFLRTNYAGQFDPKKAADIVRSVTQAHT